MLDNLADFKIALMKNKSRDQDSIKITYTVNNISGEDDIFCPQCGSQRKVSYLFLSTGDSDIIKIPKQNRGNVIYKCLTPIFTHVNDTIVFENLPWLIQTTCLQCKSEANIIIYEGPNGDELVVLHSVHGGCITPNSPDEVKFYVDQAYRARSMGAISGAMAMYRSALEWILHEQGFTDGMLGKKLKDLEAMLKENKAPTWAKDIDSTYLSALKEIGNGAIHTNNGDITKQQHLDDDAIKLVDLVFAEILDKIYEQPQRAANRLAELQKIQKKMEKS